jgi:hypothetical protein
MGYTCSPHNIFNKFTRFVHYLNKPNVSQPYESKTQKSSTCLLFCTHVASLPHNFYKLELLKREKFIKN